MFDKLINFVKGLLYKKQKLLDSKEGNSGSKKIVDKNELTEAANAYDYLSGILKSNSRFGELEKKYNEVQEIKDKMYNVNEKLKEKIGKS